MSYNVSVDTSKWDAWVQDIESKFDSLGDFFQQFLEDQVIPQLQALAGSERNVITGKYMNDWQAEVEGPQAAVVVTDAYYWVFLEYGTQERPTPMGFKSNARQFSARGAIAPTSSFMRTGRGIQPKPIVGEVVATLSDDLTNYLAEVLGLDSE